MKDNVDDLEIIDPTKENSLKFDREFSEEEKRKLDEEFLKSDMFKDIKAQAMKGKKKFRNPMKHLTPKKKKRK